jgi:hypothetical protein
MKKLAYLVMAFGLVYIGLVAGCQKQETTTAPAAPEMTNTPSTNAPAQ